MENKLNKLALEQYATKYTEILADNLFTSRNSISGKGIIEEIPVKQVSLFVLYNLFKVWKLEMLQLKSPYFNYDNRDVKLKLNELMNLLSKSISISKENFIPLLSKSVEQTLLLMLSPLKYYEDLVDSFDGMAPSMDEVKDLQRFVKINSNMRDALLTAWASNYSNDEIFDKAFEGLSEPPEEVSTLISPFNELLTLDLTSIWDDVEAEVEDDIIEEEESEEVEFQTIHTQFSEEKTSILADSFGFESSKSSLKSILTINQKFMFVNDLFDGRTEDFNKVIDFLDTCDTKDVVLKFIHNNYIERGSWKAEAPQVKEFFVLIDKKFG